MNDVYGKINFIYVCKQQSNFEINDIVHFLIIQWETTYIKIPNLLNIELNLKLNHAV